MEVGDEEEDDELMPALSDPYPAHAARTQQYGDIASESDDIMVTPTTRLRRKTTGREVRKALFAKERRGIASGDSQSEPQSA